MILTREQVREFDRRAIEEFGIPGMTLMENAGRGAAELLLALGIGGLVTICCGKGNNGGDGLVLARHLDGLGVRLQILLFARPEEITGDARVNYHIAVRCGLPVMHLIGSLLDPVQLRSQLHKSDWIVDALFGTGLNGPVRRPYDEVIQLINESHARVLAIDIPSGLDCNTGEPHGVAVQAAHTFTFWGAKKGFFTPDALKWLGQVHVIGLGVPRRLLPED